MGTVRESAIKAMVVQDLGSNMGQSHHPTDCRDAGRSPVPVHGHGKNVILEYFG